MKPLPHVVHKFLNALGRRTGGAAPDATASGFQATGFVLGKKLGEGTYATVRLAWSEGLDRKVVAVKIVERNKLSADFCNNFFSRELEILRKLNHKYVIRVTNIVDTRKKVYIFMQHAENGDLFNYLDCHGPLDEVWAATWFHQIVEGLQYCHEQGIAHRDLKTDNILITRSNTVLITDFGLARMCLSSESGTDFSTCPKLDLSRTFCGSPAFAAPEILSCYPYNPMVADVWSLGIVLYNMLSCRLPFDDSHLLRMLNCQQSRKWSFSSAVEWSQPVKKLIAAILEPNIVVRLSVQEILVDQWFEDVQGAMPLEGAVCGCGAPTSLPRAKDSEEKQHDDWVARVL